MPTNDFVVGEMLNKRTPNSKTFILFSGKFKTEIHMGPVHFDDEHGNLHNINTDLFDEADFDVIDEPVSREINARFKQAKLEARKAKEQRVLNRDNHNFQALRVPFDCHIPRNFQRGYTIGKGQDKITFKPVKSSPAKGYVNDSDRSIITYQDVWNDTDVQLQVQTNGLKETILLKTDRAPSSFSFEVKGKEIAEDFTAGALKLMPAWLRDANGVERDVEMKIVTQNDNKVYVELNAYVTDLVYPIEIDPTVVIQPDESNSKDAFTYTGGPNSTYNNTGLQIGYESGGQYFWTYIQFDLSALSSISSEQISGATIDIFQYYRASSKEMRLGQYVVTEPWNEDTITYNNSMFIVEASEDSGIVISDAEVSLWRKLPIINTLRKWLDGTKPNYGIRLASISGDLYGNERRFYSSSYGNVGERPKLTVTYNAPPSSPRILAPNGGETWNSLHTIELQESTDDSVIDTGYSQPEDHTVNVASNQPKAFQTFIVPIGSPKLKGVKVAVSSYSSTQIKAGIYTVDANGFPLNLVGTQKTVSTTTPLEVNFDLVLLEGQKYAMVYEYVDGITTLSRTSSNIYTDGNEGYYYGGAWNNDSTVDLRAELTFYKSSHLQYNIQLSTDINRTDWRDIVGLTTPGVTQYPYDFINEPESSVALVRGRAFDGSSYSEWDYSDGVFTIQHNQAPTAPTNLSPSGGQPVDRAQPVRASWLHNDPDNGDPQAKFDFQWRVKGTTSWNTVSQVTINQFYDLMNLPHGEIEWRVRTYDQAGLSSPYSAIEVFLAADKPAAPTIVSPGVNVSVANPTVQWSSVDQVGFRLRVLDEESAEVYSHIGDTNKAHTIQYDLGNQSNYTIETTITNADGLESDADSLGIAVSYTPPAKAQVNTSSGIAQGAITLDITNPIPSGTEPAISHNDVYRRKQGESNFIRIANNLSPNTSFIDYTPASDLVYEYYVRAWGDNGTYSDSNIVSESVSLEGIWLSEASNPSNVKRIRAYEEGRNAQKSYQGGTMQFEGRKLPMANFSTREENQVNFNLQIEENSDELAFIRDLADKRTTVLYRDHRGRRIFGVIFSIPETDEFWGYSIPIEFRAVSFEESV